MTVPKLRFKCFNEKWELKKVGELLTRVSNPVEVQLDLTYRQIGIRSHGKGIFHKEPVTGKILGDKRVFWLAENLLVLNIVFAWEQAVAKTSASELGMIASHRFPMYQSRENFADIDYFLQLFLTTKGKYLLELASPGGAGRNKTLGQKNFEGLEILISTQKEQTKIANFLTLIDGKITQLTQKRDLLTQYKKGMMQRIFSQEIRFKDDAGEDFSEWEEHEIKDIAEVNPKSDFLPDEFIYINLESVEKGVLLKKSVVAKEDAPSRAQRVLQVNDVLFQMVRPYQGNNLLFKSAGDYVASTGYAQIRTTQNPVFLYYLLHLESFTAEVMNRCTGTSYPAINSSDLATIPIIVPGEAEQVKIANFLSAIDAKINVTQAELEQVKQYKKGLLQQMFV